MRRTPADTVFTSCVQAFAPRSIAIALMHRLLIAIGLVGLITLVLVSCASVPPPPAAPAPAPTGSARSAPATPTRESGEAPPAPAPRSAAGTASAPSSVRPGPLAAERRWLSELFDGTPVRVMAEADGAVRVQVPLKYAFDPGSTQPKPPLHVVLERVGQSLKRHPASRLGLAAPGPGGTERQRAMREQLVAMGLAAHRVSASLPSADTVNEVSLRLAAAPSAIQRLQDRDLRKPGGAGDAPE